MSKVWITRTRPGADETAEKLRAEGFSPIVAPLLELSPPEGKVSIPTANALLVFTSKNAVRAFCQLTKRRDWNVVTVGDATADLARESGFKSVMSASGTSARVTELIKRKVPNNVPVVHFSGQTVRGTIVPDLKLAHYAASRVICYETHPVKQIPNIDINSLDYVLLHSPLAAACLRNLNPAHSHLTAISISPDADAELIGLQLRERRVANSPNEREIIAALLA